MLYGQKITSSNLRSETLVGSNNNRLLIETNKIQSSVLDRSQSMSDQCYQDQKPNHFSANDPYLGQNIILKQFDTSNIVDYKKLHQIQLQEREIQKIADELITLKEVVKKLKISIGISVQEELQNYGSKYEDSQTGSSYDFPFFKAISKLERIRDKRITPEYKQWITQYFYKILQDVQQIKSQFLNYEKARINSENIFQPNQQKPNINQDKSYETLIQYQIKCKFLQYILKLCKSKGILSASDQSKYLNQISIINNQSFIQNLQKYQMNDISDKVKTLKKSGPQQFFYQWKTIHDEIQIVNLQEIQRFYKEKKLNSYLNNYDNNQNGILIIGGSGVGKTTLFLSMAGEKMLKKKIKSRNCQFENYQAADEEIANQYKTSPFSTSCTREPAKLEAPKKYTFPEELCLIDTAGFEDNRSGQIDIMNTLYTYETIQKMKKLRIIIVISQKNIGERDQELSRFAKSISRYFKDYQEVRQSILFVLTKFDNSKKLKIACDNILKASSNQKDSNQYRFIKHLQESIIYKECIEFKLMEENIAFQSEYLIDPIELDCKLKKLYKNLLKKFPIHHEYENDCINLDYSLETKDKLIQKKCYLENMIRKLYKEGNNNFRFYLEQLMFYQSKISKIQNKKLNYPNSNQNTFDILNFIDEINQEVISKFTSLLQEYFSQCNPETLKQILQLKNRYSNMFIGNIDAMAENAQILQEDYQQIFQQITQTINGLKIQFDKIVEEKQAQIIKTIKYKAQFCHDIKNKKWLCAVLNFAKDYFQEPSNKIFDEKQGKSTKKKSHKNHNYNKEFKNLINIMNKNEQKFKKEFSEEFSIMSEEVSNFLTKKTRQSQYTYQKFLKKTQKEMFEFYNNFKNLVFHNQMIKIKNGRTIIEVPSDQKIFRSNLEFIASILKQSLDKQFGEICQNIDLMNIINHSLKDTDPEISRNVFQEVQRYSKKLKMYHACDKSIYELIQSFHNRVMKKVNLILKEINSQIICITKKQSESQIRIVEMVSIGQQLTSHTTLNKLNLKKLQRLNLSVLYCYLSKLNEIKEFPELKTQMDFQIKCFHSKIKEYLINLEKYLIKCDEKLAMFKNLIKKYNANSLNLETYELIKNYVEQCIEIEHQIKIIHHYLRNQETKETSLKFQHLIYINSIFYRHSRFLQSQKKSIRESYELREGSDQNKISFELVIDYVILQQIYIQKIKFDDSNEFKKMHNAYQDSFESKKLEFSNQFQQMKTHQLKMLNQCKRRIFDKLIEYPLQMQSSKLDKIQTEDFQLVLDPEPIKKSINIFLYYIKLKEVFQDIVTLNNQEPACDFKVIQLSDISSPLQNIEQNIAKLGNLVATISEIASFKYTELKESLLLIVLDDNTKNLIVNYLKCCHCICQLFDQLQKHSIQGLQGLEQSLERFKRINFLDQIKQFVDKSESIFYRLSKNIDNIELQHLQNMSELVDKPQTTKDFLRLLKLQCCFFYQTLEQSDFKHLQVQTLLCLKELLKKMEEGENQMDIFWEDQIKQLQKASKDPKDSLHKLIKQYQLHISKISTQKTLEYRFAELKKQELSNEIKQFLADSSQNKFQNGHSLCQQLKNYLNFLKSMKIKMVVNYNEVGDIKSIEQMEKFYQKQTCKSQAPKSQRSHRSQKSQNFQIPMEFKQSFLSAGYLPDNNMRRQSLQKQIVSDFKTNNFGLGQKVKLKRSFVQKNLHWDENSVGTNLTAKNEPNFLSQFLNVDQKWCDKMLAIKNDINNKKLQLSKSQSSAQFRNRNAKEAMPNNLCNDMTKSGLNYSNTEANLNIRKNESEIPDQDADQHKKYKINYLNPTHTNSDHAININMKKSANNLKYAPPLLNYSKGPKIPVSSGKLQKSDQLTPLQMSNLTISTPFVSDNKLLVPSSNQYLQRSNTSGSLKTIAKNKSESKINFGS